MVKKPFTTLAWKDIAFTGKKTHNLIPQSRILFCFAFFHAIFANKGLCLPIFISY